RAPAREARCGTPELGGLNEISAMPPERAARPDAASSVAPVVIHYRDSLRPCLRTSIAPRRRATFRQTLLLGRRLERVQLVLAGLHQAVARLGNLVPGSRQVALRLRNDEARLDVELAEDRVL